jgi:hypothetical protein
MRKAERRHNAAQNLRRDDSVKGIGHEMTFSDKALAPDEHAWRYNQRLRGQRSMFQIFLQAAAK